MEFKGRKKEKYKAAEKFTKRIKKIQKKTKAMLEKRWKNLQIENEEKGKNTE